MPGGVPDWVVDWEGDPVFLAVKLVWGAPLDEKAGGSAAVKEAWEALVGTEDH